MKEAPKLLSWQPGSPNLGEDLEREIEEAILRIAASWGEAEFQFEEGSLNEAWKGAEKADLRALNLETSLAWFQKQDWSQNPNPELENLLLLKLAVVKVFREKLRRILQEIESFFGQTPPSGEQKPS